jgi:hypothetical protein
VLHVSNGDCGTAALRAAGLEGRLLAWDDALHEGPVPTAAAPDELRATRARWAADRGWASYEACLAGLARRDAELAATGADEEVVLWLDADLYDQLQLLEVVARIGRRPASWVRLDGPGEGRPHVAALGPEQVRQRFAARTPLTDAQRGLARAAWAALGGADPRTLAELRCDAEALPHLAAAITRLGEELPWTGDGLARTERQVLRALASGKASDRPSLMAVTQAMEEQPFLGDVLLWDWVHGLGAGEQPLVREDGDALEITDAGRAALAGELDRAAALPLDRWVGAVRVTGPAPAWRWDAAACAPVRGRG